jgi:hypothetical protein
VLGTISNAGVPMALSFISMLALDDLKLPWMNTFTDAHGGFQVICPRPGRYKIIVAKSGPGGSIRFSSITVVIPPEKRGFFYHVGELDITGKTGRRDSLSPFKDTIPEKAALLERKASRSALLWQSFYISGRLVGPGDEILGYTSISITSFSDTPAPPIHTFTRKDGSFQAVCPTPGRYRIYLSKMEDGPEAIFDLSSKTEGILDIGVKKLEQPVEKKQ